MKLISTLTRIDYLVIDFLVEVCQQSKTASAGGQKQANKQFLFVNCGLQPRDDIDE